MKKIIKKVPPIDAKKLFGKRAKLRRRDQVLPETRKARNRALVTVNRIFRVFKYKEDLRAGSDVLKSLESAAANAKGYERTHLLKVRDKLFVKPFIPIKTQGLKSMKKGDKAFHEAMKLQTGQNTGGKTKTKLIIEAHLHYKEAFSKLEEYGRMGDFKLFPTGHLEHVVYRLTGIIKKMHKTKNNYRMITRHNDFLVEALLAHGKKGHARDYLTKTLKYAENVGPKRVNALRAKYIDFLKEIEGT